MFKLKFYLLICTTLFIGKESLHAHSHHTYIVEQAPPPVVIIQQQAPRPVFVAQPTPQPVQYIQTPVINPYALEAPPTELFEEASVSPGNNYVWQKGHWQWNGSWAWVSGRWAERPQGHTAYIPGYWKLSTHHHRWEWVAPYWQ
ncbi:MAG: YXWGXW repeat-containing protein [Parachlamydiaceae bacterium]|nr:YXWGXW repeat-containing protein [Parachlamydiaceae bacterium]